MIRSHLTQGLLNYFDETDAREQGDLQRASNEASGRKNQPDLARLFLASA